jgi:hypothetical protein
LDEFFGKCLLVENLVNELLFVHFVVALDANALSYSP